MSIGALVLEFVAEAVLPTLATEVGTYAVRRAAQEVVRGRAVPGPSRASAPPPRGIHAVAATTVLSQTPGRVRLRVVGLPGDARRAADLTARLEALAGVRKVSLSAVTGSALVEYDAARLGVAQIRTALEPQRARSRRGAGHRPAPDSRQLKLLTA